MFSAVSALPSSVVLLAIQWGVEVLLVASCHRNHDMLQPDRPPWPICIGAYEDFYLLYLFLTREFLCVLC